MGQPKERAHACVVWSDASLSPGSPKGHRAAEEQRLGRPFSSVGFAAVGNLTGLEQQQAEHRSCIKRTNAQQSCCRCEKVEVVGWWVLLCSLETPKCTDACPCKQLA